MGIETFHNPPHEEQDSSLRQGQGSHEGERRERPYPLRPRTAEVIAEESVLEGVKNFISRIETWHMRHSGKERLNVLQKTRQAQALAEHGKWRRRLDLRVHDRQKIGIISLQSCLLLHRNGLQLPQDLFSQVEEALAPRVCRVILPRGGSS